MSINLKAVGQHGASLFQGQGSYKAMVVVAGTQSFQRHWIRHDGPNVPEGTHGSQGPPLQPPDETELQAGVPGKARREDVPL